MIAGDFFLKQVKISIVYTVYITVFLGQSDYIFLHKKQVKFLSPSNVLKLKYESLYFIEASSKVRLLMHKINKI